MFYFIETDKKLIDEAMSTAISASCSYEDEIVKFMRYSALNGKRLRGILTLEFAYAFGGTKEEAMPYAVGVECVQAYSLIHDDLPCMDDDDVRRGKPSCHIAFGEANALLAGDALLTHAFSAISESDSAKKHPDRAIKAIEILSKYAGFRGMVAGQVMDLENEGKKVGIEDIEKTDALKTGELIRAACVMGCIAAGRKDMIPAAEEYARCIGISFQIVDDILDVTSDEKTLGKPIGSDDENKKCTYVSLLGIERSKEIVSELTEKAKEAMKGFDGDAEFLIDFADKMEKRKN